MPSGEISKKVRRHKSGSLLLSTKLRPTEQVREPGLPVVPAPVIHL